MSPGGYGPPGGGYDPPGGGYGPPGGGYGPPGGHGGGPPGYGPLGYGPQGYAAQGYGPQGYGHAPGVEFGPAQNAEIEGTATWARVLGIVGFVQAGYQLLSVNLIGAIISLVIALAFFKGGGSLRTVTQTQGQDVHHLISALGQFGSAFMVRIVLTAIGLGLMLLVGVGLLVVAIAFQSR